MLDRNQFLAILAGSAGVAIASMELFSASTAFPLVAIPFASSIVSIALFPKAEPAQPRAPSRVHARGSAYRQAVRTGRPGRTAVAVSLAMIAMHLTDTFHPDPLVVVNGMSWSFLFAPIAIGALLLALFAFAWHNLVARGPNRGDTWPLRWW